jgi:hypothetical protein
MQVVLVCVWWHAPESNYEKAKPRAKVNSNSLEAVAEYFMHTTNYFIWSSSTGPTSFDGMTNAYFIYLSSGFLTNWHRNYKNYVACVRP